MTLSQPATSKWTARFWLMVFVHIEKHLGIKMPGRASKGTVEEPDGDEE